MAATATGALTCTPRVQNDALAPGRLEDQVQAPPYAVSGGVYVRLVTLQQGVTDALVGTQALATAVASGYVRLDPPHLAQIQFAVDVRRQQGALRAHEAPPGIAVWRVAGERDAAAP